MTTARLPPSAWLLISGDAVSALGTGLVLPLTLIYLHQVRGIPLTMVGLLLAASGAISLLTVPLAGIALDWLGARPVLIFVLAGQAAGEGSLAIAHSAGTALPAVILLGCSLGPAFPAFQTMLARLNPDPAGQQRAFAMNFTGVNAGIGLGGAVGAAVVSTSHPGSFQVLFGANALSCLIFAVIVTRLPNVRGDHGDGQPKASYREVLAERRLRTVLLAVLLLAFTGYAAMDSGLPAYATVEAGVSVHVVALSITVNTGIIVSSQLGVLRLVRRLRRSRALAAIGLIWAVSWAIFGLSAWPVHAALRITCVLAFSALFAVGETVMAPTIVPLLNSLAADRIRGRANALSSLAYSVAFVVSPAICASMIAAGLAAAWIGLLCLGCLGTVALGLRLGRTLGPGEDLPEAPDAAERELTPARGVARDAAEPRVG